MSLPIIFVLALGLSMDAFSLSLIYGTLNLKNKIQKITSIIVGIFHFFMPILGYSIGKILLKLLPINPNHLVGIIFIMLSIEMFISIKKDETLKKLTNLISIIIFSFTVSIDSFSTGIAFSALKNNIIIASIIFSIVSSSFTYIGLLLGKKLVKKFGSISTIVGSFILFILGITYLI